MGPDLNTMKLTDVRRLTGANFFMNRPGAAAEACITDEIKGVAVALWRRFMRDLLDGVGWQNEQIAARSYPGGVSLMVSAPIDGLHVATDMVEWTWDAVAREFGGEPASDLTAAISNFRQEFMSASNPRLIAIATAADEHGVSYLGGDETVSVGLGTGCRQWREDELPAVEDIDWSSIHDVPVALVTGTNGKSTTVRLAAAIGNAAGRLVGLSSSDWVRVGRDIVDEGDYSGPAGARLALRHPDVTLGIIENARGGLMRRGLSIPRADACLITNIAADHLGDYGITDVQALGDAKFLIVQAVKPGGRLVLNADDRELVARSTGFAGDITWYGLSLDDTALAPWLRKGGHAAFIEDGMMMLAHGSERNPVLPVSDFAPGLGGVARYNISNALGAIALAAALDLPVSAMTAALSGFKGTPEENPGRGNFIDIGGFRVLVDFAHNPHGVTALAEAVRDIPAKRRLFLLGQAGDRGDEDIREMTRVIWNAAPDMIIVKELGTKLRGRQPGEVPAIILDELSALGVPEDRVITTAGEIEAVRCALQWARPGDFLVLLLHVDRKPAMDLLTTLADAGWQAGDPLP